MPPGWDGIETIGHLWEVDPELQIVICTAYSDYTWNDIQESLGASHNLVILKKPFEPIEISQLAHALTAKWSSIRQPEVRMRQLDMLIEQRTAELHELVEQLERAKAATQDALTNLPNRDCCK